MDEHARLTVYADQLVRVHVWLRDMLDDLRDGVVPSADFETHCIAFCTALTAHHTGEDEDVFPVLAARHPELRDFLRELRRDHEIIAGMLERLRRDPTREEMNGLAAVLETHFRGEEKRLLKAIKAVAG